MYYFDKVSGVSVIKSIPQHTHRLSSADDESFLNVTDDYVQQTIVYYQKTLKQSTRAIEYLKRRHIFKPSVIEHFSLGFADRTLGKSLKNLGYSQEEKVRGALQCSGLLKPSGYEFFCGAIVFPFFDENGRVTGAYGRRISTKLRPKSAYYLHWISDDTSFFNLNALLQYDVVVLCKSPLEAVSLYRLGYPCVIAAMSLNSFNDRHIDKLLQHNIRSVLLACSKNSRSDNIKKRLVKLGIDARFLALPSQMDINHCLLSFNAIKAFLATMEELSQLNAVG